MRKVDAVLIVTRAPDRDSVHIVWKMKFKLNEAGRKKKNEKERMMAMPFIPIRRLLYVNRGVAPSETSLRQKNKIKR